MNKAYRLIWSMVKEAWVVVALSAALMLAAGSASALPTGSQVISGMAGITTSGSSMTITNSANAIINWQGFSIANGETTRFIQPSALSAVLNRVTGGNPSQILGALQSNGKVLLINPSGIIFGPGSRVDVNGLIASTLDITNQDFLAGKMKFTAGAAAGKIENQGVITTPSGGSVYLIAPDVQNSGVITAPNGDVLLAAGKEVLLVDSSNPEIAMVVTASDGQALNLGTIVADAGRVGMYGSVVRQQGRISADSAVKDASGRIFLKATKEATLEAGSVTTVNGPQGGSVTVQASEGTTLVSGSIEAKGAEGAGGTVQILGQQVGLLDNAVVDASGTTGGGTVLVGGDYQGKNPLVLNATAMYMGKDAVLKADATDKGDGGRVIVWSENSTKVYGAVSACGGANGGNGGLVETSAKQTLDVAGIKVDASSPEGINGQWLLDPSDITVTHGSVSALTAGLFDPAAISSIGDTEINNALNAGTDVTIQTSAGTGGTGAIVVNGTADVGGAAAISNISGGSRTLTLNTAGTIGIHSGATIAGAAGNPLNLTLNSTGGNTIAGTVDNSGGTTALTGATTLSGTIKNGTISSAQTLSSSYGTLDGVVLGDATHNVLNINGGLYISNNLTLADGLTLNKDSGT